MTDLVARGTVTASFDVQSDFLTYKSGVYSCSGGTSIGGHAVSIIGYGTDASGTDYWIGENSPLSPFSHSLPLKGGAEADPTAHPIPLSLPPLQSATRGIPRGAMAA